VLLSFCLMIVAGTLLLMHPAATVQPASLSLIDALFTATSAVCVTGLVVVDTGHMLTPFGQLVILTLIQLGGLGIMTFSTFFVYLLYGRLGFTDREVLIDTLSQDPIPDLTRLLKIVLLFTAIIELFGFAILTLRFLQIYEPIEAAYYGLFHAVSAFCNAGFALYSDSFVNFQSDWIVNLTVGGLVILGGLGFIVVLDLYHSRHHFGHRFFLRLSLHTRVVLLTTGVLLILGTCLFFLLELNNSLSGRPLHEQLLISLFQSITTRTAGFNTVEVYNLTNTTLFIFILLMFIGASPGSTGGGIKTTTFAVLLASISNRWRMREDVNILSRRIPEATVSRVISVLFFSLSIVILFTMLLMIVEIPPVSHAQTRGLFLEYLFEVVSAYGTVGLTTGITPTLSPVGKVLIAILMLTGRLGPLTLALAMRGRPIVTPIKYVQDNVLVG
jgi:trk system potassium uptake protein TrkH